MDTHMGKNGRHPPPQADCHTLALRIKKDSKILYAFEGKRRLWTGNEKDSRVRVFLIVRRTWKNNGMDTGRRE